MAPQDNRPAADAGPGEDRLDRLLAERGDHLLHAAIALTGSRPDAEDLLQAAVERFLRRRPGASRPTTLPRRHTRSPPGQNQDDHDATS